MFLLVMEGCIKVGYASLWLSTIFKECLQLDTTQLHRSQFTWLLTWSHQKLKQVYNY